MGFLSTVRLDYTIPHFVASAAVKTRRRSRSKRKLRSTVVGRFREFSNSISNSGSYSFAQNLGRLNLYGFPEMYILWRFIILIWRFISLRVLRKDRSPRLPDGSLKEIPTCVQEKIRPN
jgi:hypothetical protein